LIHTTAIIAISVDGKISTAINNPARFSTKADLEHLETQISLCDAIIFGANTLRAYGTSLVIKNPELLQQRKENHQPSQPLPRGLLTTSQGIINFEEKIRDFNTKNNLNSNNYFEQVFINENTINWQEFFIKLTNLNYKKIGILGGKELISSLIAENLINEIWLTICPLIIGRKFAPDFLNFDLLQEINLPINLKLLEVKQIDQEIFLHYLILT